MRLQNAHEAKGIRNGVMPQCRNANVTQCQRNSKPKVTRRLPETEHAASDLALRSLAETFLLHSQVFTLAYDMAY